MSGGHPRDLNRTLASLDGAIRIEVLHLLVCPRCASEARQELQDSLLPEPLETRDLLRLERLQRRLESYVAGFEGFKTSLKNKKRTSPVEALVRARLECLVADLLSPALRDLESISEVARGNVELGEIR